MTTRRIFLDGRTANPEDYYEFFADFTNTAEYVAGDWTTTNAGSGTVAINTGSAAGAAGGQLVLTGGAADDALLAVQNKLECFKFVAGKKLYFSARFKLNDVTQSDIAIGLQVTDTTPLAVADGLFFRKDDGDAFLDFVASKNSSETQKTAVATLVNDTFVKVAFYYDGADSAVYVDDNAVGRVTPLTNVVDDEELCISFAVQNGEAVSKVMTIDYVRALVER
ncbi:hypothetical protein N8D56_21265 [Devosia sp. A8/3-2]|nr:hypothetical protein N8D56_21265 [Devosia sp. A8/3-2]